MAGASLLALLDDIASILDDVALMTKTAAKKTAGVLGDDLALNAQQVSGVVAERELPVVWAVARGSFRNKLILIPAALLISAFAPWLITPLLMLGGAYLCFEGAEKVLHRFLPSPEGHCEKEAAAPCTEAADIAAMEKEKITGAVRTDFVLSAEIIVIALGSIPEGSPFMTRALVICLIGLAMTVGVYGLVAGIVKLDDAGIYLTRNKKASSLGHKFGLLLLGAAPVLMRLLAVAGTIAMFMVGGDILAHGMPFFHYINDSLARLPLGAVLNTLANAALGFLSGAVLACGMQAARRLMAACR